MSDESNFAQNLLINEIDEPIIEIEVNSEKVGKELKINKLIEKGTQIPARIKFLTRYYKELIRSMQINKRPLIK